MFDHQVRPGRRVLSSQFFKHLHGELHVQCSSQRQRVFVDLEHGVVHADPGPLLFISDSQSDKTAGNPLGVVGEVLTPKTGFGE